LLKSLISLVGAPVRARCHRRHSENTIDRSHENGAEIVRQVSAAAVQHRVSPRSKEICVLYKIIANIARTFCAGGARSPRPVMTGLGPVIHEFSRPVHVDGPIKPGHEAAGRD
jgi:hypothetical protein